MYQSIIFLAILIFEFFAAFAKRILLSLIIAVIIAGEILV
jgi:hypothetical protein